MKTSDDIPAGPLSEHELRELWNQQADEHNQWESLDSDEQLAWAQVRAIARDREAVRLAESDAGDETGRILHLAKIIRDVDGNHDKGAAALAEVILSHPDIRSVGLDAKPVAANASGPGLDDLDRLCEKHEFHYEDNHSLQCLLNIVRDAILRWSGLAAPPADGEVAELVEWLFMLRDRSTGLASSFDDNLSRIVTLLQQRYPAPVPVSERLPEPGRKVLACYVNDLNKCRTICAVWVPAKTWDAYTYSDDDNFGEHDEETDKYFWPEGWYETIENWDDYQYARVHEGEVTHWQPLPQWPTVPPVVKESSTTAHALPLPAGGRQL
jgi:hypothetical protein